LRYFTVTVAHRYPNPAALLFPYATLFRSSFVDQGDGMAKLSGTPAVGQGGVYSFTIKASNGVAPDATQNFTLTVNEAPSITSAKSSKITLLKIGNFTVSNDLSYSRHNALI